MRFDSMSSLRCGRSAPRLILRFDSVNISTRTSRVDPVRAGNCSLSQPALHTIGRQVQAIHVHEAAARRGLPGQFVAQDDEVVLFPEPFFGLVERSNVAANGGATLFEKAQLIPQRFDLLAPLVKVLGALSLLCARERFSSESMRHADPAGERVESTVSGPPSFRHAPQPA